MGVSARHNNRASRSRKSGSPAVPCRGGARIRSFVRWRHGQLPHSRESVSYLREIPDQLKSVLDRVQLIGKRREHNELVRYYSAGGVSPPERIGETQSYLAANAAADFQSTF
jgi:hypothetical protein